MLFTDRADAGHRLAEALRHLEGEEPVVLGLPRGGVPVAFQVARALHAPLDVIVVRKLGVPYQRELGFGAIGEGGVRVISDDIVRRGRLEQADLASVEHAEAAELARQAERFRAGRPRLSLEGRTAIVVDDGIATGATAAAACQVARAHGAARVVLAVPVAPPDAAERLRGATDEFVCLSTPFAFSAVGEWYQDFSQTPDDEVVSLLAQAAAGPGPAGSAPDAESAADEDIEEEVAIDAAGVRLTGDLNLPAGARAVVMFAHGSGSSRHSPRNRLVATALNEAGLGTLLFDLLTPAEEAHRANVFDIATLAERLTDATGWLRDRTAVPVGYFGASTGAAAALWAAAAPGADVAAVVSRGGRPDLAGPLLPGVRAPTLLIVGGNDSLVIDLNREAEAALRCTTRLDIIPGATHLFEEHGALQQVADLARDWFISHLVKEA
ncbi:phosphoribosyltransferase family protein [Streptomyces sp. Je 1-4]|uniref:phosphoribosyltransferase family protein n=1 Tax=Streptomyces TaxID=1883 RepID=UPI0021D9E42F|nr:MULTISPECIES: phosphoribosyltransferase family protein [unclassified Streptomyces]UYB43699.1 phosphoribosyltransferase family protein [Streptomyces sp. Je 1-4]UZQ40103.1 phosphoribosyltransferase family protein [Streptomyces sp. Je 1-4] [Streptomyces sp. Je 1-4 4N24]UZQ47520.1 phosphoribosyltransferase family protein [Streptomyces sp. Je 1-4] [Streptomyces sp. Je 1-4 4N24_ara]